MNESTLRTGFVCIATEGKAVDGRDITRDRLTDMAETYDPTYYTAVIWPDHDRWSSYGTVQALKTEEVDGKLKLFAVLCPNRDLVYWNQNGQYQFCSIEPFEQFADLGRTYLRVVDYKTGGKEFKLKEVYCGLDCQMLLYLFTLERNAKRQFPGATAAGVEYLLADPAPKSVDRSELGDDADPAPTYPMNGLLLDEESIYRAMDTKGTGEFVPLSFSAKTGKPLNAKSTLADTAKLGRIRDHLDGLLIDMAKNLYSGRIDAEPLCTGGRSPCTYCEFRCACTHRDGEHERTINIKDDPFAE